MTVRAKLSETGKRRDEYFDTKKDAEKFIADTLEEREEHGKQSLSSGDLIGFIVSVVRRTMRLSIDLMQL